MIILSIDPGYERLGIAIIEKNKGEKEKLLFSSCFKTSAKLPHYERLTLIGNEVGRVIDEYKPTVLSIENLFFEKNLKTAMKVSEARGTILYASASRGLTVFEYTPLQVKTAVTGYGRADKGQVTMMVSKLIVISKEIKHDDEYDAIALGLTHFAYCKI